MKNRYGFLLILVAAFFGVTPIAKASEQLPTAISVQNLDLLKQTYRDVAANYKAKVKTEGAIACIDPAMKLAKAGVDVLLDDAKAKTVSLSDRVVILNDYAFWLSCWHNKDDVELKNAKNILDKVTALDPTRSVAWLNLGDVVRAMIPLASSADEKAALWQTAKYYYARYKDLGGKDAPKASELSNFNIPQELKSSGNVCDYVASAANKGVLKDIESPVGTAKVKGVIVNFVVGYVGNSGEVAFKEADNKYADSETGDKIKLLKLATIPAQGEFDVGPIYIIPYKGAYYTYSTDEVVDPVTGPVCRVVREESSPKLVENKNPVLCEQYLREEVPHNVPWTDVEQSSIPEADVGISPREAYFSRIAQVSFSGKASVRRVAYFNVEYSGHMGCTHSGVALLDKDGMSTGDANKSLLAYQNKWWSCGEADADLVRVGDRVYVDAKAGKYDWPQRVLLGMTGEKFEPICRIAADKVYKSEPIRKEPAAITTR